MATEKTWAIVTGPHAGGPIYRVEETCPGARGRASMLATRAWAEMASRKWRPELAGSDFYARRIFPATVKSTVCVVPGDAVPGTVIRVRNTTIEAIEFGDVDTIGKVRVKARPFDRIYAFDESGDGFDPDSTVGAL